MDSSIIQMKDGWLFSMIPAISNPTLGTDWAENITMLTVAYDNQYIDSVIKLPTSAPNNNDYIWCLISFHNLTLSYGIKNGRYNISFECRNFTDAKLYDNFSLQKAGRAFYGKLRIYFGNYLKYIKQCENFFD